MMLFSFLLVMVTARQEIWPIYSIFESEQQNYVSHFRNIKQGYFVDFGGFNAVIDSNSIIVSTWNGLIVEANQKRAGQIRDYYTHVTVLNFAITNKSGEIVTFYQIPQKTGLSSLSKEVALQSKSKIIQLKAITINMADLCHKYFKTKPTVLNIDLQGMGQTVLLSNDWSNNKCIPQTIHAQDHELNEIAGLPNIQNILKGHNYTKVYTDSSNKFFVHNNKLQFYKKQVQSNLQYIKNKKSLRWQKFVLQIINKLLQTNAIDWGFIRPKTDKVFLQFRHLSIINIIQINRYSNFISQIGSNRPILIMQYDVNKSSIYIGTNKYTISQKIIKQQYKFKIIYAQYIDYNLTIYIFDHRKYDTFDLKIIQIQSTLNQQNNKINKSSFSQIKQQNNTKWQIIQINQQKNKIKQQIILTKQSNKQQIKSINNKFNQQIFINNKQQSNFQSKLILIILIIILILIIRINYILIKKQQRQKNSDKQEESFTSISNRQN